MPNNCIKCGISLTSDDIGATKKLINRGAEEFMCIPCLADKFGVTQKRLNQKIDEWRETGCSLFSPKTNYTSD